MFDVVMPIYLGVGIAGFLILTLFALIDEEGGPLRRDGLGKEGSVMLGLALASV